MPRRPSLVLVGLLALATACGMVVEDLGPVDAGATRPLALGDPTAVPGAAPEERAVPLEQIVFDTFDGGSLTFPETDVAERARLLDAIRPLDAPAYESAEDAAGWLEPDDVVIGVIDPDGGAWAYPTRILDRHEIVNEELAGQPLVVTWCPLCGSGVVFDRRLPDGRLLSFSNTSALFENDMVMVDRETGSYWWQVAGRSILGPLTDTALPLLVSETTTFERWVERHPTTAVLERPGGRSYPGMNVVGYGRGLDDGRTPFPVSDGVLDDDRLAASTPVLVIELDGATHAIATAPERTEVHTIGGRAIRIELDGRGGRAFVGDEPVPTRAAYWFAAVSLDPDVVVLGG